MTACLDTTVVVHILRRQEQALAWLSEQKRPLLITPIVWMEIIAGVRSKQELQPTLDVLNHFRMIYPTRPDFEWAMHQQKRMGAIGTAIDLIDYMVASVSFRLAVPVYTHNLQHFRPLLGDAFVIKPYSYN